MKSLLALSLLAILISNASAQDGSVVLKHGEVSRWSIDLGASREVQYGTFVAPCGCTFQPSGGYGFLGDVRYEMGWATDPIALGAAAGVHYMHYTTYEEPDREDSTDVARIGMTYLTIEPLVRYTVPGTKGFLRLGANIGYLASNTYQHETRPIADPEEDVDSSMGDLRPLRLAASLAAGYSISMGSIELVPTIGLEVPLNTIRDEQASGWKVVTYYATIGIRL
jgi:hypothetical protein